MSLTLRPYQEYKDSGLPWLGEVPARWGLRRIRTLLREKNERIGNNEGVLLSLTRTRGLLPQTEASNRIASAEDLSNYKPCRPGDLVMNRMQAWSGMFAVSPLNGLVSPDYSVFSTIGEQEPKYFEHLFKTPMLVEQFAQRSKGIGSGFNRLYTPDFGSVPITRPPADEQSIIVRFLAHFDYQVRRFIAAKRRLIALLNEQKQAIIQRAVTRGLDPNVRLKPSGIESLGDVPEHWQMMRLKHLLSEPLRYGANEAAMLTDRASPRYIRITDIDMAGNLIDGTFRSLPQDVAQPYLLKDGDILLARSGATVGKAFLYWARYGPAAHAGYLIRARVNAAKVYPAYLYLYSQSSGYWHWVRSITIQATIQNVSAEKYAALNVILPPLAEQESTMQSLAPQIRGLEAAIENNRRAIELIREYRTRLIADVVTGKLDVRGVELPQLKEAEEPSPEVDEIASAVSEECRELEAVEETDDAGD